MYSFSQQWEARRLVAVVLATLGVVVVVYGGSQAPPLELASSKHVSTSANAVFIGDLLTTIASIGYGFNQVIYKKYVAWHDHVEASNDAYERVPSSDEPPKPPPPTAQPESQPLPSYMPQSAQAPCLPYGLHGNFVASCLGLTTLLIFWIPIPILHYAGIEKFAWPENFQTILFLFALSISAVVFNAGFIVRLALFPPK